MKKKHWFRVKVPTVWRPKPGDEIIGTFIATEIKLGPFGEYMAHYIKIRANQVVYASGTVLDSLFAVIDPGTKVKLVFTGLKQGQGDRTFKAFELFTEEAIELKIAKEA